LADGDIENSVTYLASAGHVARSYYFDGLQVALQELFG